MDYTPPLTLGMFTSSFTHLEPAMSAQPLACDLTGIPADLRQEHMAENQKLLAAVEEVKETPDGYAFRLPAETDVIVRVGRFMSLERLCCPFFHFTLSVEPEQGPVWLHLTGGEGVKAFVRQTIVPQVQQES